MTGNVHYMNQEKGYGFIKCEEFPKGVFFHIKNFDGDFENLQKGDEVSFEPEETPKGMAGVDVRLA